MPSIFLIPQAADAMTGMPADAEYRSASAVLDKGGQYDTSAVLINYIAAAVSKPAKIITFDISAEPYQLHIQPSQCFEARNTPVLRSTPEKHHRFFVFTPKLLFDNRHLLPSTLALNRSAISVRRNYLARVSQASSASTSRWSPESQRGFAFG
jgi:hypothetical protein